MLHNIERPGKENATPLRPWERLTVSVALFLTVLCIAAWAWILVAGDAWIKKRTPYYSLDADLLKISVSHGYVSRLIGKAVEHLTGDQIDVLKRLVYRRMWLEEFREFVCVLPKIPNYTGDLCKLWRGVQFASWMLLFAGVVSCILMAIAGLMLYWYAFVRARRITRIFIKLFYFLAPLMQITAVVAYSVVSIMVMNDMIPRTESGACLGSSVLFSLTASIFSCGPFIVVSSMLGKLFEEARNEARSERKKFAQENPELYDGNYGAMEGATLPAAMAEGIPPAQAALPAAYFPEREQEAIVWQPPVAFGQQPAYTEGFQQPPDALGQQAAYDDSFQQPVGALGQPAAYGDGFQPPSGNYAASGEQAA